MNDLRERKQAEREERIQAREDALRKAEEKTGRPTVFASIDAMVPAGGAKWVAPEPSPETLEYFAETIGFVEDRNAPEHRDAPRTNAPANVLATFAELAPRASIADAIADGIAQGVNRALAAMGLKSAPVPAGDAPPLNEDR